MSEGYDPYNHTPSWMVPVIYRADQWTPEELEEILKLHPIEMQVMPMHFNKVSIVNYALRKIGRFS